MEGFSEVRLDNKPHLGPSAGERKCSSNIYSDWSAHVRFVLGTGANPFPDSGANKRRTREHTPAGRRHPVGPWPGPTSGRHGGFGLGCCHRRPAPTPMPRPTSSHHLWWFLCAETTPSIVTMVESSNGMWIIGYGSLIFKPPPLYAFRVTGTLSGFIRRFWQSSSDHRGTPHSPGRVVTLVSLLDLQANAKFHSDLCMFELNARHRESDLVTPSVADLPLGVAIREHSVRISSLTHDDLKVWGVAYYISPENVEEMKQYLDVREQDGYSTHKVLFHVHSVPDGPEADVVLGLIPRNANGDLILESMIYIGTIDNESFIGPEDIHETAATIKTSHGPSGPNYEYLHKLTEAVRDLDPHNRSRDYYLEDLTCLASSEI